jgi:hypothetical protein
MICSSRGKTYDVYAAEYSEPGRSSVWYGTIQRVKADGSDGPIVWGSDPTYYRTSRTALNKAKQEWKRLKAAGKI